jgi:hypothetical protein
MTETRSHDYLTPRQAGDLFVTLGSGQKMHVIDGRDVELNEQGGFMVAARCGRRGRKLRQPMKHRLPENTAPTYSICYDCREFCRGVDI